VCSFGVSAEKLPLELALPVNCKIGENCFIQNYVDRDISGGIRDYQCGTTSYNGHKGTDFRLIDYRQLQQGVNVLAAAAGVVKGIRNNVSDWNPSLGYSGFPKGKECGNGLVVDHGDGWETQYCHMRKGSISLTSGDRVDSGQVLGQVGLSGKTEFPHLHLSVRKAGRVIDPFAPNAHSQNTTSCQQGETKTLWQANTANALPYQQMIITNHGIHSAVPKKREARTGQYRQQSLMPNAKAIVLWIDSILPKKGTQVQAVLRFPSGKKRAFTYTLEKNKAQWFQYFGIKLKTDSWPLGRYQYAVRLLFNNRVMSRKTGAFKIQ